MDNMLNWLLDKALDLAQQRKYPEALVLLTKALLLSEDSEVAQRDILTAIVTIQLHAGELTVLEQARKLFKLRKDAIGHLLYGEALNLVGYHEEAADILRKALKLAKEEGTDEEELRKFYYTALSLVDCRYLRKKINLRAVEEAILKTIDGTNIEDDADFFANELLDIAFCRLVRGEIDDAIALVELVERKLTKDDPEYDKLVEIKNILQSADKDEIKELLDIEYHPNIAKLIRPIELRLNPEWPLYEIYLLQARIYAMLCVENKLVKYGRYRVWAAAIDAVTSELIGDEPLYLEDLVLLYNVSGFKIEQAYDELVRYIQSHWEGHRRNFMVQFSKKLTMAQRELRRSIQLISDRPYADRVFKLANDFLRQMRTNYDALFRPVSLLLFENPALLAALVELSAWKSITGEIPTIEELAERYQVPKRKLDKIYLFAGSALDIPGEAS